MIGIMVIPAASLPPSRFFSVFVSPRSSARFFSSCASKRVRAISPMPKAWYILRSTS
jgi:hypothetical protein